VATLAESQGDDLTKDDFARKQSCSSGYGCPLYQSNAIPIQLDQVVRSVSCWIPLPPHLCDNGVGRVGRVMGHTPIAAAGAGERWGRATRAAIGAADGTSRATRFCRCSDVALRARRRPRRPARPRRRRAAGRISCTHERVRVRIGVAVARAVFVTADRYARQRWIEAISAAGNPMRPGRVPGRAPCGSWSTCPMRGRPRSGRLRWSGQRADGCLLGLPLSRLMAPMVSRACTPTTWRRRSTGWPWAEAFPDRTAVVPFRLQRADGTYVTAELRARCEGARGRSPDPPPS